MKVCIAGGGKVGMYLAQSLLAHHHKVTIIEPQEALCRSLADSLDVPVVCGDAISFDTLRTADVASCDAFVAVTGNDEDNLVACQIAKREFGVDRTVARASNPKNRELLHTLGVDTVVCGTDNLSHILEREIETDTIRQLLSLGGGTASLNEILLPENFLYAGKAIMDIPIPGDTILIEGGMPHAIGAGCFLVEIQEPTDYTIRVERTTPSGFAVADSMCHQGLGFEKMFECFHYEPHSREEIHDRWFIEPETVLKTAGGSITTLVGYRNTSLFRLDEVNVSDTLTVDCPPRGSGIYVLEGAGTLSANGRSLPLKKTDQLFVPAGTGRFTLYAEAPLRVLHFFGPEQKK